MSQAELGARMAKLRPTWSRSAVVKLENFDRESVPTTDLLALALVLDVPPQMLIADPRYVDEVPVADGVTVKAWEALMWLAGTGTIAKSDLDNYGKSAWLIDAGWKVVRAVAVLDERDAVLDPDDPEQVRRTQKRDDERHRDALRSLATAITRISAAGAPLPPMLPLDYVYRRARELDVHLPGMEN